MCSFAFCIMFSHNITHVQSYRSYGPDHAKMCLMPYANNKGADQPAHPRSLISTFVVRCLDSMIYFYTCYIRKFKILASFCSWAGWFESYLVENPQRHIFAWCGSYSNCILYGCIYHLWLYRLMSIYQRRMKKQWPGTDTIKFIGTQTPRMATFNTSRTFSLQMTVWRQSMLSKLLYDANSFIILTVYHKIPKKIGQPKILL